MRIISGTARSRIIQAPAGKDTRPTLDRVRENLFNILQHRVYHTRVLDLFAGSGQLGIEALSRGARVCTFVESNRSAYKIIEGNLERCRIADKANLVFSEAKSFLMKKDNFDIAFLDPPYHQNLVVDCLPSLTNLMSEDGVIICETAKDEELPQEVNSWQISKQKKYGKTLLTYYRKG